MTNLNLKTVFINDTAYLTGPAVVCNMQLSKLTWVSPNHWKVWCGTLQLQNVEMAKFSQSYSKTTFYTTGAQGFGVCAYQLTKTRDEAIFTCQVT